LHTWRADIDYCITEALTIYGKLGIKVWVCKGEILSKKDLVSTSSLEANTEQGGEQRRQPRRDSGNRRGAKK
jgi:small subunit ribosomal protein S3